MGADLFLSVTDARVKERGSRLKLQGWSLGSASTHTIFQKWLQPPVLVFLPRVTPSAAPAKA